MSGYSNSESRGAAERYEGENNCFSVLARERRPNVLTTNSGPHRHVPCLAVYLRCLAFDHNTGRVVVCPTSSKAAFPRTALLVETLQYHTPIYSLASGLINTTKAKVLRHLNTQLKKGLMALTRKLGSRRPICSAMWIALVRNKMLVTLPATTMRRS